MLRLVLLLGVVAALQPARASAYVVVPNHHAELQRAARSTMSCPGMVSGRYVVEVTVTSEPYRAEARLLSSPPIGLATEQCIELAFTRQLYQLVRGTERFELPFVFTDGWP
jgi:hypothetical protein